VSGGQDQFDREKAELFEALSHPVRIKILMSLSNGPLSFSQLKHVSGIESSGQMAFHLSKLGDLILLTKDGDYALSPQGIEAAHFLSNAFKEQRTIESSGSRRVLLKIAFVLLVLIAFSLIAAGMILNDQVAWQPYAQLHSDHNVTIPAGGASFGLALSGTNQNPVKVRLLAWWVTNSTDPNVDFAVVNFEGTNVRSLGVVHSLPPNATILVSSSSDTQFPSFGRADMVYYWPSGNYYLAFGIINNSTSPVNVFSLVIRFEEPYDPFGQEGWNLIGLGLSLLALTAVTGLLIFARRMLKG
jgi:DNA-binding transcriptional ArsR family regulator